MFHLTRQCILCFAPFIEEIWIKTVASFNVRTSQIHNVLGMLSDKRNLTSKSCTLLTLSNWLSPFFSTHMHFTPSLSQHGYIWKKHILLTPQSHSMVKFERKLNVGVLTISCSHKAATITEWNMANTNLRIWFLRVSFHNWDLNWCFLDFVWVEVEKDCYVSNRQWWWVNLEWINEWIDSG